MMADEWGPWVQHDGLGCPVVGQYVWAQCADERCFEGVPEAGCDAPGPGYASFWVWRSIEPHELGARVIRYRVRKPRALIELIEMVENLPHPEKVEA